MADLPDRWRPGDPLSAAKLAQITKALSSAIGVPTTSDKEPGRSSLVYRLTPFRAGEPITAAQLNEHVRALNSRWRVPTTSEGKTCAASLPERPAQPWVQGETITAAKLNELVAAATQREQACKDSASETDEEPLQPPTDVSATDGTHADKVTVTWTASVDAPAEYDVFRATSAGGRYTLLDTVAAVTLDDGPTGVDPFRPYWYQVRSLDGTRTSRFAGPDDGYRTMRPPTEPSATDEETYVLIEWTASLDTADTYEVWHSATSGGTFTLLATVSGTATSYSDFDEASGYYKVRACKSGVYSGCSEYTSEATATASAVAPVTGVSATTNRFYEVLLFWTDSATPGYTREEIWVSNTETGTYTLLQDNPGAFYRHDCALPDVDYWYKIRPYNLSGDYGPFSAPVLGRIDDPDNGATDIIGAHYHKDKRISYESFTFWLPRPLPAGYPAFSSSLEWVCGSFSGTWSGASTTFTRADDSIAPTPQCSEVTPGVDAYKFNKADITSTLLVPAKTITIRNKTTLVVSATVDLPQCCSCVILEEAYTNREHIRSYQ